eukprot:g9997.t1
MRSVCRSARRHLPPPPPKIAAFVVATSLALLFRQDQALQCRGNMFASKGALRRASAAAAVVRRATAAAQPVRLLVNGRGASSLSMAWGEDGAAPRRGGRPVDRGFSSGGVAADSRGGGRSGRGSGGYDRDFGGRESTGRGGSSGSWSEGRGAGEAQRRGGQSSYGDRESARGRGGRASGRRGGSFGGRQSDFGGRDDGPSRAWTPASGGDGGAKEMAWGAGRGRGGGGAQRYADDDDEMFAGEEDEGEGGEGWGASRSSPASDWMRGELADYQAELSPNDNVNVDMNFDMVYGIAPVLNVLRNNRREKLGLYCQDGLAPGNKKDRVAANQIYDLARETDVPMTTTDKGYLNTLCGNRPHQGFILKARPLQFEPILFLPRFEDPATAIAADKEQEGAGAEVEESATATAVASPKKQPPAPLAAASTGQVWLALDEVTDPQNFGALLRSAHFFGASGVVTCAKNSASLTATVSKSSAGAVEVMRVHSTANMMRFLKRSRENGWRVVGTSVSERSGPLHELPAGPGAPPTIVVLGNEGYGVRTNVLRECEFLVEVAGDGGGAVAEGATASTVDSLNVSVTGGVVLFHLLAGAKHAAAYVKAGSEPRAVDADPAAVASLKGPNGPRTPPWRRRAMQRPCQLLTDAARMEAKNVEAADEVGERVRRVEGEVELPPGSPIPVVLFHLLAGAKDAAAFVRAGSEPHMVIADTAAAPLSELFRFSAGEGVCVFGVAKAIVY